MNSASAFCWASAPASVAGVIAPARVNGVATTGWPQVAISMSPSDIGPSRRSGEFELTIVIRLGSRTSVSRSTPRVMHATSIASSTTVRAEGEALPGLVEQGRERPVHVEVPRLDRQVRRLEGAAALLVDDVEAADDADVGVEVGGVAGAPATIDVGHERRPADRAEDEVPIPEHEAALRVPGVQLEARRGERDERLDLLRIQADPAGRPARAVLALDARAGPLEPVQGRARRGPRTPMSRRIVSEARWIASTWSADRISIGRYGLTMRRHGRRGTPAGDAPGMATGARDQLIRPGLVGDAVHGGTIGRLTGVRPLLSRIRLAIRQRFRSDADEQRRCRRP